MKDKKQKDYEVGYGKPPKQHQFKKGQSGNKKGRPKGGEGLKTILDEQINSKITISEHGKQRKVSQIEITIIALTNKAMKGDIRTANRLLDFVRNHFPMEDLSDNNMPINAEDQAIFERLKMRFKDGD